MKKLAFSFLLLSFLVAGQCLAHTSWVGYSGAPGTNGTCATSCHGSDDGTVMVFGFPTKYEPLQQYTIQVWHVGGRTIRNFNASARVGDGSDNAGTISAGLNTIAYSVATETNGIHLSSAEVDSATFIWTAPEANTGLVKLYFGAYQGYNSGGRNTTFVLDSVENQLPTLTSWGVLTLCILLVVSAICILRRRRVRLATVA
jgi:hypothetical protein